MPRSSRSPIPSPRWRRAAPALLALALVAGCASGSGGGRATSGSTTSTTVAGTASRTATTLAADDASAAPEGRIASGKPVPSSGCGSGTTKAVDLERHEIGDRFYLLSSPAARDTETPLPLVLDLHGLLEGARIHATMSAMGRYAATHGFIVATPHGSGQPVGWNVSLDRSANPDLVFLDAVLDQVEADRCVDTSRVYATGLSYGAMMSSTLACAMSDRIAAVAPVDGLRLPKGCDPERPVPVLTFHGTKDPILLFNGGVANLGAILSGDMKRVEPPPADLNGKGVPATVAAWAEQNGCTGDPVDSERTASVTERTWRCPTSSPVVFEIMVGAGHSWPGSAFSKAAGNVLGTTDMSIDGNDLIWRFFQRFRLPSD